MAGSGKSDVADVQEEEVEISPWRRQQEERERVKAEARAARESGRQADACQQCGGMDLITDYGRGDVICRGCGEVMVGGLLDDGAEWRTFANETGEGKGPNRAEKNSSRMAVGGGSITSIDSVPGHNGLLRAHQRMGEANKDQVLYKCAQRINAMIGEDTSEALTAGVHEACLAILEKLNEHGDLKRRTSDAYMCSVILLACREQKESRTIKEVAEAFPSAGGKNGAAAAAKEVAQSFHKLQTIYNRYGTAVNRFNPAELITRYCSKMDVGLQAEEKAAVVMEKINKYGLAGNLNPAALVGAAIVFATDKLRLGRVPTIRDVATCIKVPEQQVHKVYEKVLPALCRIFQSELASQASQTPAIRDRSRSPR